MTQVSEVAILAGEGEYVTLADGQQYEVKFNMRSLRDMERKYGNMTIFSMALAGASDTHGMLDAMLDGLAYGLRYLGKRYADPDAMADLLALGKAAAYIRAVTRAMNTALTGTPDREEERADEGWSDLPDDVRAELVTLVELDLIGPVADYVKRHSQPAADHQSTKDGDDQGNFHGALGTGT